MVLTNQLLTFQPEFNKHSLNRRVPNSEANAVYIPWWQ